MRWQRPMPLQTGFCFRGIRNGKDKKLVFAKRPRESGLLHSLHHLHCLLPCGGRDRGICGPQDDWPCLGALSFERPWRGQELKLLHKLQELRDILSPGCAHCLHQHGGKGQAVRTGTPALSARLDRGPSGAFGTPYRSCARRHQELVHAQSLGAPCPGRHWPCEGRSHASLCCKAFQNTACKAFSAEVREEGCPLPGLLHGPL